MAFGSFYLHAFDAVDATHGLRIQYYGDDDDDDDDYFWS